MPRFIGLSVDKGKGGGGLGPTEPYDRSVGFRTDSNNNVQKIEIGDFKYTDVQYNAVGLITGYNETFSGSTKGWVLTYDSQNLIDEVTERSIPHPPGPEATITPAANNIDEGSALELTVNTTNFNSGTLYWGLTGVSTSIITSDFDGTTGIVTITSSTGTFHASPRADNATEGTETFKAIVYSDSARTKEIGNTDAITINDTSESSGGDGSSQSSPVDATILADWNNFVTGKTASDNGKYWITDGTTVRQTYCIFRDGGWIKIAQMNASNDVMGSSEINAGGSWIDSEINTQQHGKLPSSMINNISNQNFLLRVTGSPNDNFLNSRQGSMIFKYVNSETLPDWGTNQDPTGTYDLCLDHDNSGTGYEIMRYSYESRTLCSNDGNHPGNGSYWVSDHNYNGSWINQIWGSSGAPICWTISNNRIHTNQHWMGGPAGSSGSNQQWGNNSSNAVAFYIQP